MTRVNEYFFDQEQPSEYYGQNSAQQLIRDPKLFTMAPAAPQKEQQKKPDEKPAAKPHILRVSICCQSCVDTICYDIKKIKGVKDVECDIFLGKVTVTGPASFADVLTAARKNFKHAKAWE